jgi:hypothetical protein
LIGRVDQEIFALGHKIKSRSVLIMEITTKELRKTYQELSNDEIEYLVYQETSLTPAAKEVLKEEIERRQLPGEWINIVDEKEGASPCGDQELKVRSVRSSSGPFSYLFNVVAWFVEDFLFSFRQIAFFALWFLLCYVAYLIVNYFIFS